MTHDAFEQWWATTPESKLELIDGRLVIGTLAGSRRIAWELLRDHGPALALPMAPSDLWWSALVKAFNPQPLPRNPEEWTAWAATAEHDPEPATAGPHGSSAHLRAYQILWMAFYRFSAMSGLGQSLGRDFVVRLGENALTPDHLFIDRARLANLHDYYLDGPPALVVEITLEGTEEQERNLKFRLYEEAGVPEYWLLEAAVEKALFFGLGADGRYGRLDVDAQGIFHSAAVPGLALSLPHLWTMEKRDWDHPTLPLLPPGRKEDNVVRERRRDGGEMGWDSVPFAPRLALESAPIRFEEFISWCGRAKFENLGYGLLIDGSEGTRRCLGLLLMTFGLAEAVKLATPREWVTFLHPEPYEALQRERTALFMARAEYKDSEFSGEKYVYGSIEGLPGAHATGDDREECRRNLEQEVRNRVLLEIARQRS